MKKSKKKKVSQIRLEYERYKKRRQLMKSKGIGLDNQLSFSNYKKVRDIYIEKNRYYGENHNVNAQMVKDEVTTSKKGAQNLAKEFKQSNDSKFKKYTYERIRKLSNKQLGNLIAKGIDAGVIDYDVDEVLY